MICSRDKDYNLFTYQKFDYINELRYSKDGLATLFSKEEINKIKLKKNLFILRVTSKKFKKFYNIEYQPGNYFVKIKEKYGYDILLFKALQYAK